MSTLVTGRYVGSLRVELVHDSSGARMQTDAPTDNQGEGQSFSPTDLVGTALTSCMVTTMAIAARNHGITFERAECSVEKQMESSPRRIGRLEVVVRLPSALTPEERATLERAARGCPVRRSLSNDMQVIERFEYDL